jgi:hypothetical protein
MVKCDIAFRAHSRSVAEKRMQAYRLTFWSKTGRRENAFPLMAQTDRDAFDRASKILARSECGALEIWRDTSLLARMNRDGGPVPLN